MHAAEKKCPASATMAIVMKNKFIIDCTETLNKRSRWARMHTIFSLIFSGASNGGVR